MGFYPSKMTIIGLTFIALNVLSQQSVAQIKESLVVCKSRGEISTDTGNMVRITEQNDGKYFLHFYRIIFGSPEEIKSQQEEVTLNASALSDSCQIRVLRTPVEKSITFTVRNGVLETTSEELSQYQCHLSPALVNKFSECSPKDQLWTKIIENPLSKYSDAKVVKKLLPAADQYCFYSLNIKKMESLLDRVPQEGTGQNPVLISLPLADGTFKDFIAERTSVYHSGNPKGMDTFRGTTEDSSVGARFEIFSPVFSAYIRGLDINGDKRVVDTEYVDGDVYFTILIAPSGETPKQLYCK